MAADHWGRGGASLAAVALLLAGPAIPAPRKAAPPVPAPARADDDGDDDEEADKKSGAPRIDLGKGPLILQFEQNKGRKMPKTAFAPTAETLRPYAAASLGAPLAYTLADQRSALVYAPQLEKECNEIVQTLLAHWKGPRPDTRVILTASTNYGARVNEAGLILLNVGSVAGPNAAGNKDELALLLAHELAHLLLLHKQQSGLLAAAAKAFDIGGSVYTTYSVMKGSQYQNNKLTLRPDEDLLIKSLTTSMASSSVMMDILLPGRDRKREIDADLLGLDLAWRSGYRLTDTDIGAFTQKNAEDDHQVSGRMQTMRALFVLVVARAIDKNLLSGTSTLGTIGKLGGALGILGSNAMAEKLFDSLASSRKRHIDPDVRNQLLQGYFTAAVVNQPFNDKTEPVLPTPKKGKVPRASLSAAARLEGNALLRGATWATQYESVGATYFGSALIFASEQADAAAQANGQAVKPQGSGLLPNLKLGSSQNKPATTQASTTAQTLEAKRLAVDQARTRLQSLAQSMSQPGNINPAVAASSAGAGVLSSALLHQEPRAQTYWQDGMRKGYPILGLYRGLGESYWRSKNPARLSTLLSDYKTKIGTLDPVIDVAVASAVAEGKTAEAEKLAARCLQISRNSLYTYCATYLGYDPAADNVKAKTQEGETAFAAAKMAVGIKSLISIGGSKN